MSNNKLSKICIKDLVKKAHCSQKDINLKMTSSDPITSLAANVSSTERSRQKVRTVRKTDAIIILPTDTERKCKMCRRKKTIFLIWDFSESACETA